MSQEAQGRSRCPQYHPWYFPLQGLVQAHPSSLHLPDMVPANCVHCLMLAAFPAAQRDQKLPQDGPWKFFCLAMTLVLFLLVLILGVVLAEGKVVSRWDMGDHMDLVLRSGPYRAGTDMGP